MSIVPGLQFGSGYLLASPLATSGNPAANPTPFQIGVVQNIKWTLSGDIKELFGQQQYPVDTAVGKRGCKGSFEFAQMTNILLSQGLTSDPVTPGVVQDVPAYAATVPGSSVYTITPTVPGSGTYAADRGVVYQATGVALTNVGSGSLTAAGQYKEAAGVYTFDAADASAAVFIAFTYSLAAAGSTLTVANHPMGWGPVLNLDLWLPYENGNGGIAGMGYNFPYSRFGKVEGGTKLEDYTLYTAEFAAFAGPNANPWNAYNLF